MIDFRGLFVGFFRSKRGPVLLSLLALAFLLSPAFAGAQELSATLSGVVTDATGAVVPHASITIAQNGVNGVARVVQSDNAGNYVATNLIAGTYSITVTSPGFETFVAKNIVLNVAEKHAVNAELKAGSTNTTITVEDNPVSVDTESSAQAGTITGTQVRELELSNRNFANLVILQAGVVNYGMGDEANTESNTGIAVNGARATANNWTLDGADINDSGSNQTVVNAPSIDAIQEFTLQRGTYDAGYGRSGGGQILVQTKQGSSTFHGTAYDFVRNTDFNANEWFNKAKGAPISVYHRNDYGFTAGGPVYIPHIYNSDKKKTFFFYSQEWNKSSTPSSLNWTTPSAGLVSGFIPDAVSGGTYTGYVPSQSKTLAAACATATHNATGASEVVNGVTIPAYTTYIPSSCWEKNSTVYNTDVFAKIEPNLGSQYEFASSSKSYYRQEIARVDHNFNDKLHFFARGIEEVMPYTCYGGLWGCSGMPPGFTDATVDTPGKNVVGNLTWTVTPKMVNELEFAWAQGTYLATPFPGQFFNSTSALAAMTQGADAPYAYNESDPYGRTPAVSLGGGLQGYAPGAGPYKERNLDRTYFDNLSVTLGKHTLRAGFQIQQMIKTENGTGGDSSFTFNNNSDPNFSYGDFLLGQVFSFGQASKDTIPDLNYYNTEFYVQDDWKVSHNLTVNLGLRWSKYPSPSDKNNTLVNFDPVVYKSGSQYTGVIDEITGNFDSYPSNATTPSNYANGIIAPRGAECATAQAVAPGTTCSPYGSKVNPTYNNNIAPRVGFVYNPDGNGKTSIRGGFGLFYDRVLNGIWEDLAFDDQPLVQSTSKVGTLAHPLSFDNVMGTGAAGAVSPTPNGMLVIGTPTFKTPSYANYTIGVQHQLHPTTTIEVAYVGNQARHLLGTFDLNQPTVSARQNNEAADVNYLRPYQGYAAFQTWDTLFTSSYNSVQVTARHKAHGLTLDAAYTWSRTVTTSPADRMSGETSNTYNIKMDQGLSPQNTPQVAEISYVYELPFLKAQKDLIGHILGGWEVSGITSFVSGQSLTVTQGEDPFQVGGNRGIGLQQQAGPTWWNPQSTRPDESPAGVILTKTLNQWFTTNSFSKAVSGTWGSEKNGAFLGPGLQRWDVALIKNTNLIGPVKFQLRTELFNAFNHENFSNPGINIDAGTPAQGGNFGQISSGHNPRIMQIAGKIIF